MRIPNARFVLVWMVLSVTSAFGSPITINNPSFETLPPSGLPLGCAASLGCAYSEGPIPGWTNSGFSGQFQPGTQAGNFTYFSTLSDGITSAYSNDNSTISQTVGATVLVGVMYTLLVDIGHNNVGPALGFADLLINGNRYAAVGIVPTPGNWSTFTATYLGLAADAGDAITIELNATGAQGNFDNVRLSDNLSNVPEPATVLTLGFGLTGMVVFERRKRNLARRLASRIDHLAALPGRSVRAH
jgi:hypothetical protein